VTNGGKSSHGKGPANPPVGLLACLLADARETVDGGAGLKEDDVQASISGELLGPNMGETSSVFADEGQGGLFTDARNGEEERKALKELGILNEHLLGLRPAKLKRLLEVLKVSVLESPLFWAILPKSSMPTRI